MNKKIYFNNKFLEFIKDSSQTSQYQSIRFFKKFNENELSKIVDELLSEEHSILSENKLDFYTLDSNFKQVLDFLKNKFYFIEAAGGLIKKGNEFLFIFRLGKWDLPKGKLDKGESIENAAVRECEEECAVKNLKIQNNFANTFHIYKYKKSFALKQTYWFYMTTDYDKKLIPQTEENIEEVKWYKKAEIEKEVFSNTYFTIADIVMQAITEGFIISG